MLIILAVISGIIFGYLIRLSQSRLVKKIVKDQTDLLLDEVESCEVTDIKIAGDYRVRQLYFDGDVIIREGKWSRYPGHWLQDPLVFVKNFSIFLTAKQTLRAHKMVDEKHAEAGRQQITAALLK